MNENDLPTLQWFPGHMKKEQRLIEGNLRSVDIVIEVLDAWIETHRRLARSAPRGKFDGGSARCGQRRHACGDRKTAVEGRRRR